MAVTSSPPSTKFDARKENNEEIKRGGKRAGAGRPPLSERPLIATTIKIRIDQKEALKGRGDMGAQIREAIDLYLQHLSPDAT
jgi:hypothetical protein